MSIPPVVLGQPVVPGLARCFLVMASAAMLVTVRPSTARSSQNDQCSM